MKMFPRMWAAALLAVAVATCHAASGGDEPVKSAAAALPDAPGMPADADQGARPAHGQGFGDAPLRVGVEPFSALAIQVKVGLGGFGIDIATPVTSRLNLRGGATFLSYNPNLTIDGETILGDIQLKSVSENFDFFPFGNRFRISPGVVFYNGNHISATTSVPGGQSFTLNDVQYLSSPSDPIRGTFGLSFGNQLAPSLTMGFGNMIPRNGGHWSVPFEIGAEYLGKKPVIALSLGGTACQMSTAPSNCSSVASDPTTQQNVLAEQADLNSDIPSALRFFPIVSIGVSYRFNLTRER